MIGQQTTQSLYLLYRPPIKEDNSGIQYYLCMQNLQKKKNDKHTDPELDQIQVGGMAENRRKVGDKAVETMYIKWDEVDAPLLEKSY